MKKIFLSLFLILICTSLVLSQGAVWNYTKDFATVTNPNAICKDNTGNIWYGAKTGTSGIVVVNSSGTALSFSPVKTFGTTSITGCQGLQFDPLDGSIVAIVNGNVLIRINATTGAVTANATVPANGSNTELSNFGIDKDGNIYFTHITQPAPLQIYDKSFVKVKDAAAIATNAPQCMAVTVTNNADWMWNTSDGSNMRGVQIHVGKTGGGSGVHHFRAGMNYDAATKTFTFSKDSSFSYSRYVLAGRGDIESFNWDGTSINAWVGEKGGKALKISLGADEKGNMMVKDSIVVTGQISTPRGIIFASSTVALIADYDKNRITQFTATPIVWKNWLFVKDLTRGTTEINSHGVAIDKNGILWIACYSAWNTISVPGRTLPSILRFKPDGTIKDTIWRLVGPGINDTLAASSRGISVDNDGNILYCGGTSSSLGANTIYRINANTLAAMNRTYPGIGSLTNAVATNDGKVLVRDVASGTPKGILIFEKNFNDNSIPNIAVAPTAFPGGSYFITRCIAVTPDGNDIIVGSTTGQSVAQFHSDNGTDGPYTFKQWIGAYPAGQTVAFDPKGNLWIGTDDYSRYDCWDFKTMKLVDGISQANATEAKLGRIYQTRGIAFSADGKTIITADFGTGVVQQWTNDISLQPYANVTFMVNTSTVPDTIGAKSVVQIRGDDPLFGPWSDVGLRMTRVSGDYWKATARLNKGKVIPFKFFTNGGGKLDLGWENNLSDKDGNRWVTVPNNDTTLSLQFVNGTTANPAQYWTPLKPAADEVAVMFRVNMQGLEGGFNKDKQFVAVRGGNAPIDWGKNFLLTKETSHGNASQASYDGTNFWSGIAKFKKSDIGKTVEFKFVILNENSETAAVTTWEDNILGVSGNRSFKLGGDTTLYWQFWRNSPPAANKGSDTVNITFRADLSNAIKLRGYTTGDSIYVEYGHSGTGRDLTGNSPVRVKLEKTGITGNIYTAIVKGISQVGGTLYYQYYLVKDGNSVRESFYNYDYTGSEANLAERRSVVPAKTLAVDDIIASVTEIRRQPVFPNMTKLTKSVKVTVTCDLRPAYYTVNAGNTLTDIQGTNHVTNTDSLYKWGVWLNGPMTGGWAGWGGSLRDSLNQKMYDDGTHGDKVAGDRIFTCQITLGPQFTADTRNRIGQEFKFGIYGGDNEGGKGGFGNNHWENIDESQSEYNLQAQFGSINPKYYIGWDYNWNCPKATGYFKVQTSGVTGTIRAFKIINANTVWACGNTGAVLQTLNGGTTWIKRTAPDAAFNILNIEAIDGKTAWAGGTTGADFKIWKTLDSGKTWTEQYFNASSYSNGIKFFDANNGFAWGDPDNDGHVMLQTTNGGTTWTKVDKTKVPAALSGEAGAANAIAVNGNNIWLCLYGGTSPRIFKSTDKGSTWTVLTTTPFASLSYLTAIDFKDANNGVVVELGASNTFVTKDGGTTWTSVTVDPGKTGLRGVSYIPGTNAIVAVGGTTSIGTCFNSPNSGTTWRSIALPGSARLIAASMYSSTVGWVGGNNGAIIKWIGAPEDLTPVKQVATDVPKTYDLFQNYPNPFNPSTIIRYQIPKDVKVSLRVYDILGKEVMTLVDEDQKAGLYEVTFGNMNVSTGIYFYHLKAGDFSTSKKMMLIK